VQNIRKSNKKGKNQCKRPQKPKIIKTVSTVRVKQKNEWTMFK